nr:hypothetical protein BaRGS_011146 [Batillaria attramentaria]
MHQKDKKKFRYQRLDGRLLFVNIVSWPKVPAPKSPQDSIPLYAAPLDNIPHGKKESASTIAIATNPEILADAGVDAKNPEERREFIMLCLDYAEHLCKRKVSRDFTILPKSTSFKGDLDKAQTFFVRSLKKAMSDKDGAGKLTVQQDDESESRGQGTSLMDQLSNISKKAAGKNGKQTQQEDSQSESRSQRTSLLDQLTNISVPSSENQSQDQPKNGSAIPPMKMTNRDKGEKQKKGQKTLIQEIGGEDVKLQEPVYQLEKSSSSSGDSLVLTVELPGVKSVADCQLDISEDDVKLYVEGKYDLTVKLPSCIDDSEAQAKFSKKQSTLTLHMPLVQS